MSQLKKSEVELRDKAIMHQQRRLKQTIQFTHKDSADLLPLDGLKRLGTSKDLQPHNIVQRRLLEGNVPRLAREARDSPFRVCSPLANTKEGPEMEERSESTVDDSIEERESPEDSKGCLRSEEEEEEEEEEDDQYVDSSHAVGKSELEHKWTEVGRERGGAGTKEGEKAPSLSALQVQCKYGDAEVKVSINTGCQYNQISSTCFRRLGLKASSKSKPFSESAADATACMRLQFGKESVQCTAQVIDDETFEICLGLQTLLELRCCVDLKTRVLRLQSTGEELPFLETSLSQPVPSP